ncbi:MAG: hypothetical protein AMJ90_06780 [candidate division Zixibacteria bacterium SM23_73_2]|nr:MAG: hypothetical protein AMJ90_06780 [candidate division Zixibacteria bacterium SM23_73_2]
MINKILNDVVNTASEFVGKALGYNNEQRRDIITNETKHALKAGINAFKSILDDMERDLDILFTK